MITVKIIRTVVAALCCTSCLQCFDTVGWASGRTSGM